MPDDQLLNYAMQTEGVILAIFINIFTSTFFKEFGGPGEDDTWVEDKILR